MTVSQKTHGSRKARSKKTKHPSRVHSKWMKFLAEHRSKKDIVKKARKEAGVSAKGKLTTNEKFKVNAKISKIVGHIYREQHPGAEERRHSRMSKRKPKVPGTRKLRKCKYSGRVRNANGKCLGPCKLGPRSKKTGKCPASKKHSKKSHGSRKPKHSKKSHHSKASRPGVLNPTEIKELIHTVEVKAEKKSKKASKKSKKSEHSKKHTKKSKKTKKHSKKHSKKVADHELFSQSYKTEHKAKSVSHKGSKKSKKGIVERIKETFGLKSEGYSAKKADAVSQKRKKRSEGYTAKKADAVSQKRTGSKKSHHKKKGEKRPGSKKRHHKKKAEGYSAKKANAVSQKQSAAYTGAEGGAKKMSLGYLLRYY